VVQEVTKGLKKFIKRNSLNCDVYITQQQNITPLNALANLIQETVTRWVSNNGYSTNVWHKMSSAWNIWTDRLRDPASALSYIIYKCDGLGLLHKAVGVLQHTELVRRTSHSLKYGAAVRNSKSDTCLIQT